MKQEFVLVTWTKSLVWQRDLIFIYSPLLLHFMSLAVTWNAEFSMHNVEYVFISIEFLGPMRWCSRKPVSHSFQHWLNFGRLKFVKPYAYGTSRHSLNCYFFPKHLRGHCEPNLWTNCISSIPLGQSACLFSRLCLRIQHKSFWVCPILSRNLSFSTKTKVVWYSSGYCLKCNGQEIMPSNEILNILER